MWKQSEKTINYIIKLIYVKKMFKTKEMHLHTRVTKYNIHIYYELVQGIVTYITAVDLKHNLSIGFVFTFQLFSYLQYLQNFKSIFNC